MPSRAQTVLLSLILLVAGVGVGLQAWSLFRQPAPVVWEYTIKAPTDLEFEKDMRALGVQGWELVSARRAIHGDSNGLGGHDYPGEKSPQRRE